MESNHQETLFWPVQIGSSLERCAAEARSKRLKLQGSPEHQQGDVFVADCVQEQPPGHQLLACAVDHGAASLSQLGPAGSSCSCGPSWDVQRAALPRKRKLCRTPQNSQSVTTIDQKANAGPDHDCTRRAAVPFKFKLKFKFERPVALQQCAMKEGRSPKLREALGRFTAVAGTTGDACATATCQLQKDAPDVPSPTEHNTVTVAAVVQHTSLNSARSAQAAADAVADPGPAVPGGLPVGTGPTEASQHAATPDAAAAAAVPPNNAMAADAHTRCSTDTRAQLNDNWGAAQPAGGRSIPHQSAQAADGDPMHLRPLDLQDLQDLAPEHVQPVIVLANGLYKAAQPEDRLRLKVRDLLSSKNLHALLSWLRARVAGRVPNKQRLPPYTAAYHTACLLHVLALPEVQAELEAQVLQQLMQMVSKAQQEFLAEDKQLQAAAPGSPPTSSNSPQPAAAADAATTALPQQLQVVRQGATAKQAQGRTQASASQQQQAASHGTLAAADVAAASCQHSKVGYNGSNPGGNSGGAGPSEDGPSAAVVGPVGAKVSPAQQPLAHDISPAAATIERDGEGTAAASTTPTAGPCHAGAAVATEATAQAAAATGTATATDDAAAAEVAAAAMAVLSSVSTTSAAAKLTNSGVQPAAAAMLPVAARAALVDAAGGHSRAAFHLQSACWQSTSRQPAAAAGAAAAAASHAAQIQYLAQGTAVARLWRVVTTPGAMGSKTLQQHIAGPFGFPAAHYQRSDACTGNNSSNAVVNSCGAAPSGGAQAAGASLIFAERRVRELFVSKLQPTPDEFTKFVGLMQKLSGYDRLPADDPRLHRFWADYVWLQVLQKDPSSCDEDWRDGFNALLGPLEAGIPAAHAGADRCFIAAECKLLSLLASTLPPTDERKLSWMRQLRKAMQLLSGLRAGDMRLQRFWVDYQNMMVLKNDQRSRTEHYLAVFTRLINNVMPGSF